MVGGLVYWKIVERNFKYSFHSFSLMDLEIRAEQYKKDVLEQPAVNGKLVIILVLLYRLQMRIPFDFSGVECFIDGGSYVHIITLTVRDRRGLHYYGPISGGDGLDTHFLLALGSAVPRELLRKPYTHFQKFQRPISGEMLVNPELSTGIFNVTAIGAYSSPFFAKNVPYRS